MTSIELRQAAAADTIADSVARSSEMHNDRTHDSTVDTDGKNLEAARIAGHCTDRSRRDHDEQRDAREQRARQSATRHVAGFDSRAGGNHLLLALEPGYRVIDKGMIDARSAVRAPTTAFDDPRSDTGERMRGRLHFVRNHQRPSRVIEFERVK